MYFATILSLLLLSLFKLHDAYEFVPIDLSLCGDKKFCLIPMRPCTAETCEYSATWVQVDDFLEIELLGNIESSAGYLALSFSSDKLTGDDSVVGCYVDGTEVRVRPAYTSMIGKNEFIDNYPKDFIQDAGNGYGIFDLTSKRLYCRFRRKLSPNGDKKLFDLKSRPFFVIMLRGPAVDDNGFGAPFPESVITSPKAMKVDSKAPIEGATLPKMHGCLMILAWVLFASIGILMARYFKDMWPSYGFRDEQIWFHIHRSCQIMCWILVVLSVALIFIYVNGYSYNLSWPQSLHPILGIIVFILTFLNPFLALCRCQPRHPDRPYFNWIHFFVGTFAYVLAVPTIMLGLRMDRAGTQLASLNYPMIILIIFVIFQVIVELTLEIHDATYYQRNKEQRMKYELQMEDYHMRISQGIPQVPPKTPQPLGRQFKYFMGGLHATVCIICAASLVIAIIVN